MKEFKVGSWSVPREKLGSDQKYINFGLAMRILNSNNGLTTYKVGDREVQVRINPSSTIGAFPKIFSTNPAKLVIPGKIPDFFTYFLNDSEVPVDSILNSEFDANIGGLSFVQYNDMPTGTDPKGNAWNYKTWPGYFEKPGYYGDIENLYINFDVFCKAIKNSANKSMKDVLLDMLNEMSDAVNSFWNFQVVEQQDKEGNIILSVVDENWIGKKTGGSVQFYHSGPYSIFLDASIDIALPSEMTNQIISRRLSLANNPDEPIVGVGGFFESQTDLFLTSYTDSNGNPKKILTEDEKKKEDEAAAAAAAAAEDKKLPSEKTQEKISASNTRDSAIDKEKSALYTNQRKLVKDLDLVDGTVAWNDYDIDGDEVLDPVKKAQIDAQIKAIDAKIAALDAEKTANKAAREILETQKKEEKKTEEDADGEIAAKAIGDNLEKIDVVPKVDLDTIPEKIGPIENPSVLKQTFQIFCMDDEPLFDRLKNDAFANKNKGTTAKGLSHPLPIKYTFKVLGTSGFRRGDTFNILGIPTKYAKHGLFQIIEIEHNVSGMTWTTSVTGQYRQMQ